MTLTTQGTILGRKRRVILRAEKGMTSLMGRRRRRKMRKTVIVRTCGFGVV